MLVYVYMCNGEHDAIRKSKVTASILAVTLLFLIASCSPLYVHGLVTFAVIFTIIINQNNTNYVPQGIQ